jgi:glutamate synthase domain-containing protein 2
VPTGIIFEVRMTYLQLALQPRFAVFSLSVAGAVLFAVLAWRTPSDTIFVMLALSLGLVALGVRDMLQTRHSILRNYPIVAHMRFLFEEVRPEIRQYFFEGEKDGAPFSRDRRSVVYQRAKMALDKIPFGTQYNVYSEGYEWMRHSMAPRPVSRKSFRVQVGGTQCKQPYASSVYNISAMSFGAISANAIRAMNKGAAAGGFAHDTGEGGVSRYHREFGGDLIWEIGSGYFGCRDGKGAFSPERFAATAKLEQIRMIEI